MATNSSTSVRFLYCEQNNPDSVTATQAIISELTRRTNTIIISGDTAQSTREQLQNRANSLSQNSGLSVVVVCPRDPLQ